MTDTATMQPIRVLVDEATGPYIKLPATQVDQVRAVLDAHEVRFWVSHFAISFEGNPARTSIYIKRGTDAHAVQTFLDAVA